MTQSSRRNLTVAITASVGASLLVWLVALIGWLTNGSFVEVHEASNLAVFLSTLPPLTAIFIRPASRQPVGQVIERIVWALIASALFLLVVTAFDELVALPYFERNFTDSGSADTPLFAFRHSGWGAYMNSLLLAWMIAWGMLIAIAYQLGLSQSKKAA